MEKKNKLNLDLDFKKKKKTSAEQTTASIQNGTQQAGYSDAENKPYVLPNKKDIMDPILAQAIDQWLEKDFVFNEKIAIGVAYNKFKVFFQQEKNLVIKDNTNENTYARKWFESFIKEKCDKGALNFKITKIDNLFFYEGSYKAPLF